MSAIGPAFSSCRRPMRRLPLWRAFNEVRFRYAGIGRTQKRALHAHTGNSAATNQLPLGLAERLNAPPSGPASRHVIFSGIQPTGTPHLGNYLGAMRQWKLLESLCEGSSTQCLYSIVDLHALTTPSRQAAGELSANGRETFLSLLAIGLDPDKSIIFFQSDVSAHAELMWILSCHASTGQLARMTQWKNKMGLDTKSYKSTLENQPALKLGLFSYPVLQAADILLYDTTIVPVGEDQQQHIEFARNVAGGFNSVFKDVFPVPEAYISPAKRIMSLKQPTEKMSKSSPDVASRILITDSKEQISQKIKGARTDSRTSGISYEPAERPGISNLVEILYHLKSDLAIGIEQFAQNLKDAEYGNGQLKNLVADAIDANLAPIRERYEKLKADEATCPEKLDEYIKYGANEARRLAEKKMKQVREVLGLRQPS